MAILAESPADRIHSAMPRTDTAKLELATPSGDHRTRPRRRGRALDMAILEATIVEIDKYGYAAFSVERVAERARASKASLYRRWPTYCVIRRPRPIPAACAETYWRCYGVLLSCSLDQRARLFVA
jgi:hypothetical protein